MEPEQKKTKDGRDYTIRIASANAGQLVVEALLEGDSSGLAGQLLVSIEQFQGEHTGFISQIESNAGENQGIGTALILYAERFLVERGVPNVEVTYESEAENVEKLRYFYEGKLNYKRKTSIPGPISRRTLFAGASVTHDVFGYCLSKRLIES